MQSSSFLQTLQEGSSSEKPSFPHPRLQWKHTLLQAILCPQIPSLLPASASSPHSRGFFLTLPPWRNPCRPAEEDGLVQFQKSLLVKAQTLWKSSWAEAISESNRVTEAWLLIECSFTADQLWLRAQAFQLKCLGQSFPHFPGPQSLQSLLEKPFSHQWHIARVSLIPRHLFFLKS